MELHLSSPSFSLPAPSLWEGVQAVGLCWARAGLRASPPPHALSHQLIREAN